MAPRRRLATRAIPGWGIIGRGQFRLLRLIADTGVFTLSGKDAAFLNTQGFPASPGTFVLTGQALNLLRAAVLGAAKGTFTLTGQNVGLNINHPLPANAGAFTLTGQAVGFLRGLNVIASVGSFSVSGQAAVLALGLKLISDAGIFTVTGQNAAFSISSGHAPLTADPGAFSLTGQAAALVQIKNLLAALGTFSLVGQDAALVEGRRVFADVGTFVMTGKDATIALPAIGKLSFVLFNNVNTNNSFTYPSGIAAGDLIIASDFSINGSSQQANTVPTGYTAMGTSLTGNSGTSFFRWTWSYKIAAGTETGSFAGVTAGSTRTKSILVFRGTIAISTVTVLGTPTAERTDGNPSSQSIAASGETGALLALAGYRGIGVTPRTFSGETADFDQNCDGVSNTFIDGFAWGETDTKHDITIDMPDMGINNGLMGFLLKVT